MFYAVMDIGSNAIRAAIYQSADIASAKIYSDKFKADIWSLLEYDDIDVKHQSYLIIEHFIHIFNRVGVKKIKCVATAVLRGHYKASIFKDIIYKRYGINVEILSGEQEAYLTTIGLMLGIPNVDGIIADLGGGSLELVEVQQSRIISCISLPLGTKLLNKLENLSIDFIKERIPKFRNVSYCNLYLIGGAFRIIARFYMTCINYPTINIHNFRAQSNNILLYIAQLNGVNNINLGHYCSKLKVNSHATMILKALIEAFDVKTVIVSNYGLKEGVHVRNCFLPNSELPADVDKLNNSFADFFHTIENNNVLYECCSKLVNFQGNDYCLKEYVKMIFPLLIQPSETTKQIIMAAFVFLNCAKNINSLRIDFLPEYILTVDLPFSHTQRVMLSLILAKVVSDLRSILRITKIAKQILLKTEFYNSLIIGTIISIAKDIDGFPLENPSFSLLLINYKFIKLSTTFTLPKMVWIKIVSKLKKIGWFIRLSS
ncbi:ppx/GppA phosphatase family protein [Orientia chuto str. Dubai]|uniref:Ppx/GppA phosphatase family protein n=2 Tax=Candidatus Orientia mediorientalis TaxID=911112 RepID=A0A0F3MJK7_9RICK|nr:ppx/GppA phosphatase family protein [Orientia chuto str. Dubai]